ncbi:hypothetical protein [Oceanicoccus sp. KOV_DT_Chl]|nr:hypothetical protein [Oceanicoccus sp. KOV_DT_Chl]
MNNACLLQQEAAASLLANENAAATPKYWRPAQLVELLQESFRF